MVYRQRKQLVGSALAVLGLEPFVRQSSELRLAAFAGQELVVDLAWDLLGFVGEVVEPIHPVYSVLVPGLVDWQQWRQRRH